MITTKSTDNAMGSRAKKRAGFAAMAGAAVLAMVSMAWACTPRMGPAQMSPSTVPRDTTFKFWAQGLEAKTSYKLYFVDSMQMFASLDCHTTSTVFTTKYKQYDANRNVVTKKGMKSNGVGDLDADFTLSGIQPYKAFLPMFYPEDSVGPGPHDYSPGVYPDPGAKVPAGRSSVCAREVDVNGNPTDYTATQHLIFTVT